MKGNVVLMMMACMHMRGCMITRLVHIVEGVSQIALDLQNDKEQKKKDKAQACSGR